MSPCECAGPVPASLAANTGLAALSLSYNLLTGETVAFAGALTPGAQAPAARPAAAGRRLASASSGAAGTLGGPAAELISPLIARKLFGGSEDVRFSPRTAGMQVDVSMLRDLATGDVSGARRRLLQAAAPLPLPPQQQQQQQAQQQAQEPVAVAVPPPTAELPTAVASPVAAQGAASAGGGPAAAVGEPTADSQPVADRSARAGNSFLYLNLSSNALDGPVSENFGRLEMFRSPANSSDPYDQFVFNRGGPNRILDLTQNQFFGEFPLFLINAPPDLSDSCLCDTNFNVSAGNYLFCPTRQSLAGLTATKDKLASLQTAGYTCLLPPVTKGGELRQVCVCWWWWWC
jgi:hypothetical protein